MQSMEPDTEFEPDDDFAELLSKVRSGDEFATAQLVQRYERAVLRSVRSRLGQSMRVTLDSMDIMQSVHRSLLLGLRNDKFQFSSSQQLIALAVSMVHRKVARKWRGMKKLETNRLASGIESEIAFLDQIASGDPTVSRVASADELLQHFLSRLQELDQQLVRLKLAGCSSEDAARLLHSDPAFIRMRWSRLRRKLREEGLK
jgi:RNA polymerase sigma-70 factor (ECF subfamily)